MYYFILIAVEPKIELYNIRTEHINNAFIKKTNKDKNIWKIKIKIAVKLKVGHRKIFQIKKITPSSRIILSRI